MKAHTPHRKTPPGDVFFSLKTSGQNTTEVRKIAHPRGYAAGIDGIPASITRVKQLGTKDIVSPRWFVSHPYTTSGGCERRQRRHFISQEAV